MIKNYLLKPKTKAFRKGHTLEDYFISVTDINENKVTVTGFDWDYVEGAIVLEYGSQNIISLKEWDIIDQIYIYFLQALVELKRNDYAEFCFPDQPIKVEIKRIDKECVLISIGDKKAMRIETKWIIETICKGAQDLFDFLSKKNRFNGVQQANELIEILKK